MLRPVYETTVPALTHTTPYKTNRYNKFRRLLQLKPLSSIDDITTDAADRTALRSVYGDDIELVDLLPGMLAESHRPDWWVQTWQLF